MVVSGSVEKVYEYKSLRIVIVWVGVKRQCSLDYVPNLLPILNGWLNQQGVTQNGGTPLYCLVLV